MKYLYLGGNEAVEDTDIVGIFDLDNASWSILTRRYLSAAEKSVSGDTANNKTRNKDIKVRLFIAVLLLIEYN